MASMIFFLFTLSHLFFKVAADHLSLPYTEDIDIAINCGSTAVTTTFDDGREWIGDSPSMLKGSSISSSSREELANIHPIPYRTARISRSQFSYVFRVNPGQKLIRLHFHPASYQGFGEYNNDLFTVEASPFTLLGNFSASSAASSLGLKYLVKEFFMNIDENKTLTLRFSSESHDGYAFINGIEIISVPSGLYYTHGNDLGAQVIGQKSRVFVDNSIALEMVHRSNFVSRWAANVNRKISNFTWKISTDVGFGYLVRLHFYELQPSTDGIEFNVLINGQAVSVQGRSLNHITPQYQDYVVMMKGHKQEGKRDLVIAIMQSKGDQMSNGLPLKGFEIFKMSNPDNSLACPNPLPPPQASPSTSACQKLLLLLMFGHGNWIANAAIVTMTLLNIVVYELRQIWEGNSAGESNTAPASMEGTCRRFCLAEIVSATEGFNDRFVIGKGGFGIVYKGFIDRGQEIVAIKRLKSDSKQGAQEFWIEVETLSKLRHVHLVSLVGYCNENKEMILVYEYMPHGTLADHLYKVSGQSESHFPPLSWEQRLRICIGAARGLDYLHTGTDHGIIHRDVKASNILLDKDFVAKVSDFGLAKVGNRKQLQSSVSTNVKGTFGYLDPDYFLTRKLTKKSDVYSFGVVLLEVICGRPAVDLGRPENERSLTMWARQIISRGENEIDQIVAPNLRGQISVDSLKLFVQVCETCFNSNPRKRPTVAQLVAQLEFALDEHVRSKDLMPREITIQSVSSCSEYEQNVLNSRLVENVAVLAGGTPNKNKPLWVWPWGAFWNKAKTPKKKEFLFPDGPKCHRFSISDIRAATNNFDDGLIIASYDFYILYKGLLKSFSTKVAIGRVKHVPKDKLMDICADIGMLSQLSHPNLASVIGYCLHSDEMIIVYDYVGNRSLSDYLHNTERVLSWKHRLKICIGAAHGLRHLHTCTGETIVHRDVSPTNVFLDKNGDAKLVAFGFHSLSPMANNLEWPVTVVEYLPQGTQYLAPEFFCFGKLTDKSDVYSFGLILLEAICGTKTLNNKIHKYDHYLPTQVKRSIQKKTFHQIIDPHLKGKMAAECLSEFLKVALSCLFDQPTNRPSMDDVVEGLELALEAQETVEAACQINIECIVKGLETALEAPQVTAQESLKNMECPSLLNGAFDLGSVYPKLAFLESLNFADSGDMLLHNQVFDSVATFEFDESLSR